MGDAVLATSLCNAIKANFPDAEVHMVLNDAIAPLFERHPSINRVVRFTNDERHSALVYLAKIWRLMRSERYDVVIDMRSTVNTLPFSLFSLRSPFRIGLKKPYTRFVFNHRVEPCDPFTSVVDHDVHMLAPLGKVKPLNFDATFSLNVTPAELADYRSYLGAQGVDTSKPILLCGVVSKLAFKCWPQDFMVEILRRIITSFPRCSLCSIMHRVSRLRRHTIYIRSWVNRRVCLSMCRLPACVHWWRWPRIAVHISAMRVGRATSFRPSDALRWWCSLRM